MAWRQGGVHSGLGIDTRWKSTDILEAIGLTMADSAALLDPLVVTNTKYLAIDHERATDGNTAFSATLTGSRNRKL